MRPVASKPWPYAVPIRGLWGCPCQAEWLPAFEAEAQRRGILTGPLPLSQLIGGAAASAGTHSTGGAADIYPLGRIRVDGDTGLVWLARQMGADATWHRPHNWDSRGGVEHVHSVLTDCPHNDAARYQIDAVRADMNGLADHFKDDGPRPLSGRTWEEGLTWAREQEDAMSSPKDWDAADWAAFNQHAAPVIADAVVDHPISKAGAEPVVTLGQGVNQARNDAERIIKRLG